MFELYTQSHATTLELHLIMIVINIHYCVYYIIGIVWIVCLFLTLEYGMHAQIAQSPTVFSAMRCSKGAWRPQALHANTLYIITMSQFPNFIVLCLLLVQLSLFLLFGRIKLHENGIIIQTAKNNYHDGWLYDVILYIDHPHTKLNCNCSEVIFE